MGAKFYNNVSEKEPQKIINHLTKTNVLMSSDTVVAVLGSAVLWGTGNCLVATEKEVVFFQNTPTLQQGRYPYKGIASVSIEQKGIGIAHLILTIGVKNIDLNVIAKQADIQSMYKVIEERL